MSWVDSITPFLYHAAKRHSWLRRTWKALVTVRDKLSLGKSIIGPQGIVEDVEALVDCQRGVDTGIVDYRLVRKATSVERTYPRSVYSDIHWKFVINSTYQHPKTFVLKLSGARIWKDGCVISRDNRLLAEVSRVIHKGVSSKESATHPVFAESQLPAPRKLHGPAVLLAASAGRGYYHWIFDVLPRLQILWDAGYCLKDFDHVIVNHYVSRFHQESLAKLGVPRRKIIQTEYAQHVQTGELVVPSLPGDSGHVAQWVCDFLRDEFLPAVDSATSQFGKRIYISRAKVGHREVTNEADIETLLAQQGFNRVLLEDLTFVEQIRILAQADVVVGPHGAGLSNIVFCAPGTKVIELFHHSAVNLMYWTIANVLGLDYYYLLSEGPKPARFDDPYLNTEQMSIDLEELKNTLRLAGVMD